HHVARQVGAALQHLGWRRPVRPLGLARDRLHAGPGEARAADPDAVAHRLAAGFHQIEELVRRIDHDRAGRLFAIVGNRLRKIARVDRRAGRLGLILIALWLAEKRAARGETLLIGLPGTWIDVLRHLILPHRTRLCARAVEDELDEAAAHLAALSGGVALHLRLR